MARLRRLMIVRFAALLLVALTATATATATGAQAQRPDDPAEASLQRWSAQADQARATLENARVTDDALTAMRQRIEASREEARALVAATAPRIAQIERELAALGPPPEEGQSEDEALAAERGALNDRLAAANSVRARSAALVDRFSAEIDQINTVLRERLVTRILQRGRTPLDPMLWVDAAGEIGEIGQRIAREADASFDDPEMRARALQAAPLAALALIAGAALMLVARKRVLGWVERVARNPDSTRERRIGAGAVATLTRLAVPVLALYLAGYALTESGMLGPTLEALLAGSGLGFSAVIATYAFSSAYFAPGAPALRVAALDDRAARRARSAAMALAVVLAIGATLVYAIDRLRADPEFLIAANLVLVMVASAAMLRLRQVYTPAAPSEPEQTGAEPDAEAEP